MGAWWRAAIGIAIGATLGSGAQAQREPGAVGLAAGFRPDHPLDGHAIVRSYRVALGDAAASRWADMTGVPTLLKNEQRWSGQRVQSRWRMVATDRWSAALYVVRSRRAAHGTMTRLIGDRVSRKALGADLGIRPSDGLAFRLRAAMLSVRARPANALNGARAVRDRRLLLGGGIELPGAGAAMLDYVRITSSAGRPDRAPAPGGGRDGERTGAGPRLTLSGVIDRTIEGAGPVGWSLSLASLRRPDLDRIDSRAALTVQLRF